MTRTDEEPLEALLRQTFADARDGAATGPGLDAVRSGAFARATRLRRRRAALQGAGATGVVAAAVLALVVGASPFGAGQRLAPAGPSAPGDGGSTRAWHQLVPGAGSFAYRFPDALPRRLPAGLTALTLDPEVVASGSPTVPAPGAAKQLSSEDPDLVGPVGVCSWDREDRRRPVAGRAWQLAASDRPGAYAAGLGLVGFTTGTGQEAMRDLRARALDCLPSPEMEEVPWTGPGDASLLFEGSFTVADTPRRQALAVVRVGDVLVGGSATGATVGAAGTVATDLASRAAAELLAEAFPPALGRVLGSSSAPPNAASAPGAPAPGPVVVPAAYEIGDVFPEDGQLRHGMRYHGDPLTGTGTPAAAGAQLCDLSGFADRARREAEPLPVAGAQRDAYAGDGTGVAADVVFSVTGWARGTGAARFADLQQDRGRCAWMPVQERDTWAGQAEETTWLSHGSDADHGAYVASRRVGDLIVSVVVSGLLPAEARAEAVRLNGILVANVTASGLPAAKGR